MGKIDRYPRYFFIGLVILGFILILVHIFGFPIILSFPYGVMIAYFFLRIVSRKDDCWSIKCTCYVAVGILTLVDASKATLLVAVVAFIEAFDIFFEKLIKPLKPKTDGFLKGLSVAIFGYNFL